MLNLWTSSLARRAGSMPFGLKYGLIQHVTLRTPFSPNIIHSRYYSSPIPTPTPSSTTSVPVPVVPIVEKHTPIQHKHTIVEKIKEEFIRVVNGSKLLGQNTKTAAFLLRNVTKGHILTRREKTLLITTTADLIRMVPFIIIVVVPFAEFALPILLKLFPNMLPSTLTSASQREASRARKLQAKLKVIELLQAASESIAVRSKLDSKDLQESLAAFMSKVSRGEVVKHEDVLLISKNFHSEFSLESLDRSQLTSLTKFFGLPSLGTAFILQESLRFKWNLVAKDDAHIFRDGIDSLSPSEVEEAAVSRGFSHSNTQQDQKQYISEWIALSQANVPPYLLLLSRAHYFAKNTNRMTDITPPIIAPYLPPTSAQTTTARPETIKAAPLEAEIVVDMPEKELIPLEFKNVSHEQSNNPVVNRLWWKIARYTSELKKETFGDRQGEVIHLGAISATNMSTVITTELRKYFQALFVALDKNGDRKLSVDEVEHGLNASNIPVRHDEVVTLVKMHDADGDNSLSFDEFVDCLLYLRKNHH